MSRSWISRITADGVVQGRFTVRSAVRHLIVGALALALVPTSAEAQFGMLKKLKKAASGPDSAARAKDSLAQIAAGVSPDSVKIGTSLLARGVSAASSASNKLEETTGISAKDAAIAATGIGATGLIAKKMGVDPMSMGQAVMSNAKQAGKQRAMNAAMGVNAMGTIPGMPDAATMQSMQAQMARAGGLSAKGAKPGKGAAMAATMEMPGMAGFTQADAEALVAFQQEMMQVAMAASAGDAAAKARLDAWQAVTLKHEAEIQKLSLAAQGGDLAAIQKLQIMQLTIMKEWAGTASTRSKVLRAVKP
jgi:hypothetical protein